MTSTVFSFDSTVHKTAFILFDIPDHPKKKSVTVFDTKYVLDKPAELLACSTPLGKQRKAT